MSDYLQTLIDEVTAKVQKLFASDRGQWSIKHSFQDFARVLRDSECAIRPAHLAQIFDLMDMLQSKDEILEADRHWILGTFALQAALEEGDDPSLFSRVVLDSVRLSLKSIEAKTSSPVVGSRAFFSFFGQHASVLSDEAFKAVMDNSVMLTRYAGRETSEHNLLFGCSDQYFQENVPANRALSGLMAHYTYDHEDSIDWRDDYGQDGPYAQNLVQLQQQLLRAHALGVKIVPHQADALLVMGFAENLLSIRDQGDATHSGLIDQTITALFNMVVLEGSQPITNNMFKSPGQQRQIKTSSATIKFNWLFPSFCAGFHSDIKRSLARLNEQTLVPEVRRALDAFAGHVLRSSAQAQAPLLKNSRFDNSAFIRDILVEFPGFLQGDNPLQGLQKTERLAILEAVTDVSVKRQLLKQYKSDKGQVLMSDLGM